MSDYLTEAIVIEILVKLPVKSLIRATSVCKQWRSLIRSPSFISLHLSNAENQVLLRLVLDDEFYIVIPKGGPFGTSFSLELELPFKCPTDLLELELPFKCPTDYFNIVGSCDGLLCLHSNDNIVKPSGPILIWNPAIRNHVILPQPLVNQNKYGSVALGFGVSRNVYKVVRLVCRLNGYPLQAEILSLGTGRWRKLCLPKFDYRVCIFGYRDRPVFFKGFVHWSTYQKITSRNSILTFHVGDEVFGEFVLPEELERDAEASLGLAVMGESLVAVKYSLERFGRRCDVWMMKDYGVKESWTRLYTVESALQPEVIGFWGRGEALVTHGCELVPYNADTKEIGHVGVHGDFKAFYVDDYKESLVLLGGYSGDSGEELSQGAARIIGS